MGLIGKIARTIFVCLYMTFYGILYTLLRPIGVRRNEVFKNKARQLNIQAAKNLECGANSVLVKLANGITLHVVEAGDRNAKLVILLHGFPDCWHSWHGVIPALVKKGYFVVAPDMRGYNLSDKPKEVKDYYVTQLAADVKELIAVYGKKTANVVAHDWGGVVAWGFAERYPELLEKLVILNAPHAKAYQREVRKNINQLLSSWYIFWFQIPYLAQNLISYPMLSFFFFSSYPPPSPPPPLFFLTFFKYDPYEAVKIFFKTKNKDALTAEDKELLACSYAQDGALPAMINYYKGLVRTMLFRGARKPSDKKSTRPDKIQTPTLILWGEDDVALVPECAMCSEWVEKVQVTYIPKCSHWVPYEVPEIVSREVIKFIA